MKPPRKTRRAASPAPAPRRKWIFRIAALLVMPLLALAVLEAALRLAGYGYSTALFEKARLGGRDYLLNNENFSRRFFPPSLSRWPSPLMIEPVKPAGTCRIFIFGESAAQGDPEPAFGAARYLEVLLRERYPGVNFEVVNVAITAINSHVIVPIARECARYQGDLWIVYMGNNEMIGPFGAATVFGAKAPPWPVVRLGLALQTTRVGQLLMDLERKLKSHGSEPGVWGGLQMFLGNQLAPDDPRKEVVYRNFHRNLKDILRAGRNSGAAIVLSTVSVNLKDCPPFASLPSGNLPPADRENCDRLSADGRGAESSGDWKLAAADFSQAVALDPQLAESQFREGQALLNLDDTAAAAGHFQKACDCDALPFRADSRINGIIRETAEQMTGPDLVLCDAAAGLPEPGKIPGDETFYEHVHFNFDGNYRLAMLWAAQAGPLLPDNVKNKDKGGWASQEVCEARLGLTDWNRCDVLNAVRQRMERPPLNNQNNNQRRVSELTARMDRMFQQRTPAAAAAARALYSDAIARAPRDYLLAENFGEFLELTGDIKQAAFEWKQAGELMPRNPFAFLTEGQLLEKLGEFPAARGDFRQALNLHPRYAEAWFELGKLDAVEGKLEEAVKNDQQAAALQPNDPQTYLGMGKALSLLKRTDGSTQAFRRALELDGANWEAHYALGGELGMHGRIKEAKAEFEQVVRLQPQYPMGHLNLGVALLKLNDPAGARAQFAETLRLDPANKSAREFLAAVPATR
ncbi:MAG TPA: tetratricopeptide repeat protein [Candidatus Baltobacteraceae bacterium]|nr:tetratricopeptide repeat protein [Candidatus Baltobacteraceae bacterium]